MGTQSRKRTTRRHPRRLASAGIAVLAITGLVTACTAASADVGTTKRAPSRYPTGAAVIGRSTPAPETPESLRLEHVGKAGLALRQSGGSRTQNEYELLRAEHQPGAGR
jgi:hypothetical protein